MIYFDGLSPMDYFTLRVDDSDVNPFSETGGIIIGDGIGSNAGGNTTSAPKLPRLDERPRPDIVIPPPPPPPKPDPTPKESGHYDIRLSVINLAGKGTLFVNDKQDDRLTRNIANGNVVNTRELVGTSLMLEYRLNSSKSRTRYLIETKSETKEIYGSFGAKIIKGPAIYVTKYVDGQAPVTTKETQPDYFQQASFLGAKTITLSFDTQNLFTPPPPPPDPDPIVVVDPIGDPLPEDEIDDIFIPPILPPDPVRPLRNFVYQIDVDFNGDDDKTRGSFTYSFGEKRGVLEEKVYSVTKTVGEINDAIDEGALTIPFNINWLSGQKGLENLSLYDVWFILYKDGHPIDKSSNLNQNYNLSANTPYTLKVELKRKQVTAETPRIKVGSNQYSIDKKAFDSLLNVKYKANGVTDKIIVSFGNVKREIFPKANKGINGIIAGNVGFEDSISFTANDFDRIGRHKIVLTPVKFFTTPSRVVGDIAYPGSNLEVNGESVVFYIDVTDTKITLGPDITHISYPENIKGADFKGYDVEFRINWASVNTRWVEVYAGKEAAQHRLIEKGDPQGVATFNVREVLTRAGQNINESNRTAEFKLFLRPVGEKNLKGKLEEITIRFDKGDLELKRGVVVRDIREAIKKSFDTQVLNQENGKYLTHLLHLGEGKNRIISTWGIDTQTFKDPSIVLKLYEPLPRNIQPNQQVWVSKIQSIPIVEQITLIDEEVKECIPLQPNFNTQFVDDVGLQIYDDLVASGSATSTDIINKFVSGSGFSLKDLDIQFVSSSTSLIEFDNGALVTESLDTDYYWSNFVKYSSAEERVENYVYKINLIDFYLNRIDLVTSGSHYTSSIALQNEKSKLERQINDVKAGFDAFEEYIYTNELSSSTEDGYSNWYGGIISSAQNYDENNSSRLTYNLPEHIINDKNNAEFVLFFDMVGQHFDNLWVYTKQLAKKNKLEHKHKDGVIDKFIYNMLESLGWDADLGVTSQALWEYAFGKTQDGTSVSTQPAKNRQNEIWRRILNNLPYLLKHKGTRRSMHALMACYGIPASMLTIMEFGGPQDVSKGGTTKFTYEDRTASINISGSAAITIPWKTYNGEFPNTFEIRLNTEERQDQQIVSGSDWSLDILKDTGSLGKVQLTVGGVSSSTDTVPLFDDEYYHIAVTRENDTDFTLYVKQGFQERIRNEVSRTFSAPAASWEDGSEIKVGGLNLNASVDEIRLWSTPLIESVIENHTLVPDAINGNHNSASSEDLIFRNDFEYPKDRTADVDIKNVALIQSYVTSSVASGFPSASNYPYQYTPYDRTVTAQVPQTGFNYSNKVRFESQYKPNSTVELTATSSIDLSYRTRSTKKAFDRAPLDSNKLGFFFSPIKEINMDILRSVGPINVDDFIGNPADEYNPTYRDLDNFREYYFQRYNLNFNEYVQLVRQIEKSMFDQLASLAPARAKVASGLLIEPHILERSKTEWKRPSGEENYHETVIDTADNVVVTLENPQYLAYVSASEDTKLRIEKPFYDTTITTEETQLSGETLNFVGTYQNQDNFNVEGVITRNSGSTMAGFEIFIDAQITGSLLDSYYQSSGYQQIGGFGKDSLEEGGFGLYGKDSYSIRTRLDGNGTIVRDKVRVFRIKEEFQEIEPQTTNFNDGSVGTSDVVVTKYRQKVLILPLSGSAPSTGNGIAEVEPLNGYFSTHYRYVEDLPTGLENSYFNGSKQTALTTLDGGSPVETFTTNPNTLRVNDSGRGSGEPILEVD